MSIKGAIFDMDGTLLDSMHLWINIGPRYLESKGIEYTDKIAADTKLMLLPEMGQYFIDNLGFSLSVSEFIDEVNAMVEHGYYYEVPAKDGVAEFLESLHKMGVPMVVATATDRHLVEAALKRTGIYDYFDRIFTCGEEGVDKSVPTIFDHALSFLGTDKSETYVFEDTFTPIKTLYNSGYNFIAVYDKWSAKHSDEIRNLANLYVTRLDEIDIAKL